MVAAAVGAVLLASCGAAPAVPSERASTVPAASPAGRGEAGSAVRPPRLRLNAVRLDPALEDLEERTFRFFWETANPANGLVPDRWPSAPFCNIAGVGFGLTAYAIGVERGWITREQATGRVLATLRFFANAPQGPQPTGTAGHQGFFYRFLDMDTGTRYRDVELSTIDTTLLLAGVLLCETYFDRSTPEETEIRQLAATLVARPDWRWFLVRPPRVNMGWRPENGFSVTDWHGYDEGMILYILALGSPSHAIDLEAWPTWTSTYRWGNRYGLDHVAFPPLFGHFFSHVWIDFRGIQDPYMRGKGIDYFENSRRAVLEQRQYAIANPGRFLGYGADVWGLSACDGPVDAMLPWAERQVRFFTYAARGTDFTETRDDGTIAPMAAASALPFTPSEAQAAVLAMRARWGDEVYSKYGFFDAFNPTFTFDVKPAMGRIVPGVGWFDTEYLSIDQGPIVAMLENYRSGLVWNVMRKNRHIVEGLRRAGFSGGWLDAAP